MNSHSLSVEYWCCFKNQRGSFLNDALEHSNRNCTIYYSYCAIRYKQPRRRYESLIVLRLCQNRWNRAIRVGTGESRCSGDSSGDCASGHVHVFHDPTQRRRWSTSHFSFSFRDLRGWETLTQCFIYYWVGLRLTEWDQVSVIQYHSRGLLGLG